MLAGLLLPPGKLGTWLRQVAIVAAVIVPVCFMALAVVFYIRPSRPVFFDYSVNYDAAAALYGQGTSPYQIEAAYSFPLPTFFLYWAGSLFGHLEKSSAWVLWWIGGAILWSGCAIFLLRSIAPARNIRERDCLRYACVAIPAMTTLWQGQTAVFILAGLVLLHEALQQVQNRRAFPSLMGGVGLAWAALIKPQLALVGLGLGAWAILAWSQNRRKVAAQVATLLAAAVITATTLIAVSLVLPGGITLDTYRDFITQALPKVAMPSSGLSVVGSPAFTAASIAATLGASDATVTLVSNAVTLVVLAFAIYWTLRRAQRPLIEIAAGWGVWAMVAPRVTWPWYAVWCLPFFLLAIREALSRPRATFRLCGFVVALCLLNLQVDSLLVTLGTTFLLMMLLWISFTEAPSLEDKTTIEAQTAIESTEHH